METLTFQADTKRLLDLVIHSLYTNRDVFLRELVANASDALDRLRFEGFGRPDLIDSAPLEIRLEVDPAARTLTVRDNGIGMSRDEVVGNIGTLARSGTRELVERLRREESAGPEMIGQFGVGFYSSFMVADKVAIVTRRAGDDTGTRWESTGDVTYSLSDATDAPRGTAVILHLKQADAENGIEDYTDRWVLSRIVKRYADFVTYPIVYDGPVEKLDGAADKKEGADAPIVLNSMKPIWTRPQADVTEEEYDQFYQHIAHDWTKPVLRISGRAEGRFEYTALLFVPAHAPFDILYHGASFGVQLYSQRMLIVENCQELVPRYLRFIKGVVDAADLPLNVSRQSLQHSHHLAHIRKWLTRKVLDALNKLREGGEDRYLPFWGQFGRVLKEGVGEDRDNRDRLLPLLLFESSADPATLTSLAGYVSRMKPDQKDIFYLTGESRGAIERSPHLEEVAARGYEVLYLTEPVDELLVQDLPEYDGRRLRSLSKGSVELGSESDREQAKTDLKERTAELSGLLQALEKHLASHVRSVRVSQRLTASPACLAGEEFDLSPQMEKLLMRGKGAGPRQRRILELNPKHPIVVKMHERFQASPSDALVLTCADLLYGYAALAEGSELADPVTFNARLTELIAQSLDALASPRAAEVVHD